MPGNYRRYYRHTDIAADAVPVARSHSHVVMGFMNDPSRLLEDAAQRKYDRRLDDKYSDMTIKEQ
jgi:hypothetical protein